MCRSDRHAGHQPAGLQAGLRAAPAARAERLTALSLRNCDGLGDAALAPLSGLLSLASLDLSGCTHLTGAG